MKHYIREGRRFVQIQSKAGTYYNQDGSFSKDRRSDSIGVCVIDDLEKTVIASLYCPKEPLVYLDAERYCNTEFFCKGHMPSKLEMMAAYEYKSMFYNYPSRWYWTRDNIKYNDGIAWTLGWDSGYIHGHRKTYTDYVRAFLTLTK